MTTTKCELCGEPMPPGEDMFKFHGYSGPCPVPIAIKSMQPDPAVRLRAALVGLVGVDGREALEQMETAIRMSPAPEDAKVAALNGIHALLATLPAERGGPAMTMQRIVLVITAPVAFVGAVLLGCLAGDVRRELRAFVETWKFFWEAQP